MAILDVVKALAPNCIYCALGGADAAGVMVRVVRVVRGEMIQV